MIEELGGREILEDHLGKKLPENLEDMKVYGWQDVD